MTKVEKGVLHLPAKTHQKLRERHGAVSPGAFRKNIV